MKQLIVTADDFGLDPAVNEAVEAAGRNGILTSASLMVGAPAAADAMARARRLPALAVGLHLVLVEGDPVLPAAEIAVLLGPDGRFGSDMGARGFRYFFSATARRALAREITAQFEAFRRTGLALDHVDTHKHMHLHPTVAGLIVRIGRDYGMRAMRLPFEPPTLTDPAPSLGTRALALWTRTLRRRLVRAGLIHNDRVVGLGWSGAMTEERVIQALQHLPDGVSEMYFHPATRRTPALTQPMPTYLHIEEFDALMSPRVREAVAARNIRLTSFGGLA